MVGKENAHVFFGVGGRIHYSAYLEAEVLQVHGVEHKGGLKVLCLVRFVGKVRLQLKIQTTCFGLVNEAVLKFGLFNLSEDLIKLR